MPPAIPIATYRLQLTADFGFARAAEIVLRKEAQGGAGAELVSREIGALKGRLN